MRRSTALKKPLSDLGMKLAFGLGADFSGMTETPRLFIDEAYHEAFIKVDEKGTEAAAATAVVMKASAAPPKTPPSFVADHPFLFVIRDVGSGTILFLGRVVDPAEA
jgi:serpin B